MKTGLMAGVLALFLAACTNPPPPPTSSVDITFQHRPPIQVNVANIEVVDRSAPRVTANRIEQLHQQNPASLARRWAEERLRASGASGQMTLIIEEAAVIEKSFPRSTGFSALFKDEVDTRLEGVLAARLEYRQGPHSGSVDVKAEAFKEILSDATLNERDAAYFDLLERLARQFDETLTRDVEANFGDVLVR